MSWTIKPESAIPSPLEIINSEVGVVFLGSFAPFDLQRTLVKGGLLERTYNTLSRDVQRLRKCLSSYLVLDEITAI